MIRSILLASSALCLVSCGGQAEETRLYLGADLSYVNEMEDCGAVYRDDGREVDPYELFAEKGANLVRLRLWHTPDWTEYSTLADVTEAIRRSQVVGMEVLLDFHYSDDWADPGDQIIPAAWADIESDEELAEAVFVYTRDTLLTLNKQGLMPEMVQVGNETNTEILLPANVPEDTGINWERNALLLNAGIRGVREAGRQAGKTPLIMLHIAQPENIEPWFEAGMAAGLENFDLIGMSYYAKWSSKNMEEMGETISRLRHKYGKGVIVVETSYPWTLEGQDEAGNILGEDSLIHAYPATLEGQKQYLLDLTQTVISNDGQGVVYWEPAWVTNSCSTRWGTGSHWENAAFFDYDGMNAHSGFDFFSADYRYPEE
ncbi:glycoside hydrolase family 53 protein [Parvularcula marina]|nr:glycosyl hydrolase 53 family protein [Parvularcula marina]